MYSVQLLNLSRPFHEPLILNVCDTFFSRLRGYMLKNRVSRNEGLLFVGSNETVANSAIHMFFMRFNIAVIWLDTERRVVDRKIAKVWRPYYAPRAAALFIIETHPDRLYDFEIGDKMEFENA